VLCKVDVPLKKLPIDSTLLPL